MSGARESDLQEYFATLKKIPLLTAEQELDLAQRVQSGDFVARDKLVEANLRLVVAIARRFVRTGICLQDLVAEGNLGLVHAADLYQPDRCTRFATYAKWWIMHSIQQFIASTAHPMCLPHYMIRRMARFREQSRMFQDSCGYAPSDADLLEQSSDNQLAAVQHASRVFRITMMDSCGDLGRQTMEEAIPDRQTLRPDYELESRETATKLRILLDQLDHREATVLRLRHGFGEAKPLPVQEIAEILGLTRQRVRQIEVGALRKLHSLLESINVGREGRVDEVGREAVLA